MNRLSLSIVASLLLVSCACARKPAPTEAELKPTAKGAAIVEVSGGKQIAQTGATLDQPVVVQVNDAQGTAVAGAAVYFHGPKDVAFKPAAALTDSSGQATVAVSLGSAAGHYQITATTNTAKGDADLKLDEIALGYQQVLGKQLNDQYCVRCHDPESTPERVSNMDNLVNKPKPFTEGETLNKMSDADLLAIIGHGGPALGKSPEMPPYGNTLSKSDLQALVSYIRAVADPPYQQAGTVYAQK